MSAPISAETLPIIAYRELPVLTTELLAQLYGAQPKHVHDNFTNNADRFVEGKHYFKLEGNALREFKNKPDNIGLVDKRAKHLILWTERGAARHAKTLDTEQAWEVFEKLEDCYFSKREHPPLALQGPPITNKQYQELWRRVESIANRFSHENAASVAVWTRLRQSLNVSVTSRNLPQSQYDATLVLLGAMAKQTSIFRDAMWTAEKEFFKKVLKQGEDCDLAQLEAKLKEAIDKAEGLPKALLGIFLT